MLTPEQKRRKQDVSFSKFFGNIFLLIAALLFLLNLFGGITILQDHGNFIPLASVFVPIIIWIMFGRQRYIKTGNANARVTASRGLLWLAIQAGVSLFIFSNL
ncbi:hypothetical protein JYT93_00490 [bacterium AH-315-J19]|nr:hypothetical protein [Robiginitomaculum sp.]MBN4058492.1 hypothetical protein [bacterium AH-315-J19]